MAEDKDKKKAPKAKALGQEIATIQNSPDYVTLSKVVPNIDYILRKAGKTEEVHEEIFSDSRVKATIGTRKAGVLGLNWDVEGGSEEHRKFITGIIVDLKPAKMIKSVFRAIPYGWQPIEVVWKVENGKFVPSVFKQKPRRWFNFDIDGNLCMRKKGQIFECDPVPDYRFLCPVNEQSYESPYGKALLSDLYWPATFKKGGIRFWMAFTDRFGMPWAVAKHPTGLTEEDIDEVLDMLSDLRQGGVGALEQGVELELTDNKVSGSSDMFESLVKYFDNDIAITTLGGNLTTSVGGGSLAAAQVHNEVRKDIRDEDSRLVTETVNDLISWVMELNFGEVEEIPFFTLNADEEVSIERSTRDENLHKVGVRFNKRYFERRYNLAEDEFEVNNTEPAPNTPNASNEFAEGPLGLDPQLQIDNGAETFTKTELQEQANGMLKPVIDLINNSSDYSEAIKGLNSVYPSMDSKALQEMISRAMLVSESLGRIEESETK